ncbi:MAG TPA: hypothetical protein VG222_12750, partial [Vicinamibacterales bacterium]|nr:hypothetical protein [Vicinamibacterales bacterium]
MPSLVAIVATVVLAAPAAAQTASSFAQGWEAGTPTVAIGVVTVIYADDFANQRAQLVHLIRDERTGESYQLRFEQSAPRSVRSGARVQIAGRRYGSGAYGSELFVAGCCDDSATSGTTAR